MNHTIGGTSATNETEPVGGTHVLIDESIYGNPCAPSTK